MKAKGEVQLDVDFDFKNLSLGHLIGREQLALFLLLFLAFLKLCPSEYLIFNISWEISKGLSTRN